MKKQKQFSDNEDEDSVDTETLSSSEDWVNIDGGENDEVLPIEDEYAQVEILDEESDDLAKKLMASCYNNKASRGGIDEYLTENCPYKHWGPDPTWELTTEAQWKRFKVYMMDYSANPKYQEMIIAELLPLIKKIIMDKARTFVSAKNADDYLQEAVMAIWSNIPRYDVTLIPPLNYFYNRIVGAIVQYNSRELGSTRYNEKIIKKVVDAERKFTALGIDIKDIRDGMIHAECEDLKITSIARARELMRNRGGGFIPLDDEHLSNYASEDDPVRAAERHEAAIVVERLLQECSEQEREILERVSSAATDVAAAEEIKNIADEHNMKPRDVTDIWTRTINRIRKSQYFKSKFPDKAKAMEPFAECDIEIASFLGINKKDERRTYFFGDEEEVEA